MDIKDLLSGSMAKQIGKAVGVDDDVVGALLKKAVPTLLDNMSENSKKKDGAESLQKALLAHADDDVDDVKKIDTVDGAKIIKHILGGSKASVTKDLAKAAGGLDADKVDDILSLVGPMVMKSVGSKSKANSGLDVADLLGDVMKDGKVDMSDIVKVASKIDADDVKMAANVLGKLFNK